MKITCHDNNAIADVYIGARSVNSIATELEHLKRQFGQGQDVLTSVQWFVPETARSNELPLVMLLREGEHPYGAVLLHGSKAVGVPSGVFKGGYSCGRGGVVGATARQHAIVEDATRLLLKKNLAHTVIVSLLRCNQHSGLSNMDALEKGSDLWRMREMGSCLSLEGGMEGVLSRFSYKMRRNFRYYKKMAERDYSCVFLPELSGEQSQAAVAAMHGIGASPAQNRSRHASRSCFAGSTRRIFDGITR